MIPSSRCLPTAVILDFNLKAAGLALCPPAPDRLSAGIVGRHGHMVGQNFVLYFKSIYLHLFVLGGRPCMHAVVQA